MTSSIPGKRDLPASKYDLSTYWGRVRQSMDISDPRTLLVSSTGLEQSKSLIGRYKQGDIKDMTPDLWHAKKVVDSTLHPGKLVPQSPHRQCTTLRLTTRWLTGLTFGRLDTGEPVFLPFRMSCFVLSNLVVTAGMLTPNMGVSSQLSFPR